MSPRTAVPKGARAAALIRGLLLACLAAAAGAATASPRASHMTPLADDELSAVSGQDGIAFNLSNFSLTSNATNPLTLTYLSPNGSSLTLSRLDLSRTDDTDTFADPFYLSVLTQAGLPDIVSLAFPQNPASTGHQNWTFTADFSNCDAVTNGSCTGTNFVGGTLQLNNLALRGGGVTLTPSTLANTEGVQFGLSTGVDIGNLTVYSRGRSAADVPDTSDTLTLTGIHLADATTGGPWVIADVTKHPGLFNAVTDTSGSYLHLQIGWPTTTDPVPTATFAIQDISFSTIPTGSTTPTVTSLGSSTIATMQLNYLDVRLHP